MQVLEDLIVALKIVTPNSKSTDENKENIQQSSATTELASTSKSEPMDVSESSAGETTKTSGNTQNTAAEAEMVSDVDCSISEND